MRPIVIVFILLLPMLISAETRRFYNVADFYGISITKPNAVCHDNDGFIWIASKDGVIRLADNGSRTYTLPYSTMCVVSVEIVHRAGRVVAFTNQGEVFVYNRPADRFDRLLNLPAKLGVESLYLSQVELDEEGGVWLASSSGLYRVKDDDITYINMVNGALGDMDVLEDGHILAGGPEGLYIVDSSTLGVERLCDVGHTFPTLLCEDKAVDRIWVGTMSDGLYYVDLKSRRLIRAEAPGFPRQYVRDIEIMPDSTIWCGIDGRGIYELSRDGKKVLRTYRENSDNEYSISGNGVQDMYLEESGRIWVCSYTGGVSVADMGPKTATLYSRRTDLPPGKSLINNYVYDIEEDSKGQLWIGTNSGLSCWNPETDTWSNFFNDDNDESFIVQAVCQDNEGNIWAGTYSHGIYVIDSASKKIKAHYTMGYGILSNTGFVFDIQRDSRGKMWVAGMIGNILCFDPAAKTFEHYPSIPVTALADLNDDTLLVLSTNRLLALDKNTKEYTTLLTDNNIRSIVAESDKIWVATSGKGLICYDIATSSIDYFGTGQGFPSDDINSLVMRNGRLWMGTPNGLYIFDTVEKTVTQCRFPATISKTNFIPDAAISTSQGQTAWGTAKGLLMVSSDIDAMTAASGHIYVDDIMLSGTSVRNLGDQPSDMPVDHLNSITFDYSHNDISFNILSLGALSYSPLFSYRLVGLEENWNGPKAVSSIRYSNLSPGDYKLLIRMHNPEIVDERAIAIHITPPFWETWWFRSLIICAIAGMLIFAFRTYLNRVNRRNAESKLQFFVTTAHDLRTSLTLIKAPVEQLGDSEGLSSSDRDNVKLALKNVDHLASLTTKLMDFQKIDTGKVQPRFTPTDIVSFVRHRIAMFSAYAEQKSITLKFQANVDSYVTAIDDDKMEQIVDNLLSNAIKYSNHDSEVEIALSCSGEEGWRLSVADHGIGISKKDRKKLFREFYRGENAINSRIGGSGIGLALVKKLVDIHGGTISLDSQENVGSTFQITIPYSAPAESPEEIREIESTEATDYDERQSGQEEMRILIAEDNDDLRKFIADALRTQFNVTAVADGQEAWDFIRDNLPDLIVSDIMMPNMDGFELCRRVKSTFETSHIPVILLSALSEQADELRGLGLGADEYLTKPFDIKTISRRIASTINNRRAIGMRINSGETGTNADPILTEPVNPLNDAFVRQAVEAVTAHLENSEFGKEEFAKEMGVSTSLLFKKIKSLTGLSIVDFIKKVRMEHAMKLMDDPSLSIGEIAYKSGFSSIGYFSTVFKKYFGKTPSECRKA
ncbi:MAG: ATP-binding protein [Muribaculum sp.]|nr:ATP-binding protein [Muribaculum sp.]